MTDLIYAKEYEDYLITGKEESLNSLVPGGIEYEYIQLIKRILNENLTDELKQKINEFVKKVPNHQSQKLKAFLYFKELESNPNNKDEIIDSIKLLFNLPNIKNIQKPINYIKERKDSNDDIEHAPSKINENEISKYEKFLNDIYEGKVKPNNDNCQKNIFLNYDLIYPINYEKIPDDIYYSIFTDYNFSDFSNFIFNNICLLDLEVFKKIFNKCLENLKGKNNEKDIQFFKNKINDLSYNLNNEELDYLISLNESLINKDNLIDVLLNRKYPEVAKSKEEKKKILLEINELLNKMNYKYEQYKRNILYSILKNDMEMNIYDLERFLEYIELPSCNNDRIKDILLIPINLNEQLKFNQRNNNNINYYTNVDSSEFNLEKDLITKYLIHFFRFDNIPMEKFINNIKNDFLKKTYYTTKFLTGDEEITKTNNLTSNEINDLMQKTILEICPHNKEKFLIDEDITLELDIKNIQTLFAKIYEINTENYYYNNQNEDFDNKISIEGILPTYEEIYNYNDKPQILNRKKLTLSKIPKKRGLYIIEFIGNGNVSRAIIHKGGLNIIYKETIYGKLIYILDENNNICKGENTGIWIDKIFYNCKKEDGSILIPFTNFNGNKFIIYKHDNFCEGYNLYISNENYYLDGIFIIDKESFIMGNVVKCLVRPILKINDEICDIKNLKNVEVNVNCIKIENNQNIPISFKFDNIKLSNDKDYEFEFQIPSKIISINLSLNGQVIKKTNEEKVNLSIQRNLNLNRSDDYDCLFKVINGEFIGEFLGKNGEPKINIPASIDLECKYQNKNNQNLESDSNGKINFGKLKNINSIKVNERPFHIDLKNNLYHNEINILKDDELKIPIHENDLYYLIKSNKSENLTNEIKKEITDKENGLGHLLISKIPPGEYILKLNQEQLFINVIDGKYLNDDFYITKDKIGNISKLKQGISLEKVSYKDNKLNIKINSKSNPRVHITVNQYYPEKGDEFLSEYNNLLKNININKYNFNFKNRNNQYLNNSILSEEIQYVLDRKQYEKKMGNLLDKPSLLLKPQFIRDTNTAIIKPKEGRDFDNLNRCCKMSKCGAPMMDRYGEPRKKKIYYDINMINVHDFINVSPCISFNNIPNEKGEILLECDLSNYCILHIIGIDDFGAFEEYISLNNDKSSKRDLRMVNKLNLDKNYCELRKVHCLNKGENYKIPDITSVNYKIFDSIEKYANFFKLVNPNLKNDIEQFDFLYNFDNLNLKEKIDKISEYFSHEVNIYLFFHDNDFFNQFIYPIIKYKSEKSFIDYFLLKDTENIKKFTTGVLFNKLNSFEKCLLIYSIRKENPTLAKNISRLLRSQVQPESTKNIKQYFNIALNLKTKEEEEKEEIKYDIPMNKLKKKKMKMSAIPRKLMKKAVMAKEEPMEEEEAYYESKIVIKANLNKEKGKVKEYCETHYYNKVFNNSNYLISNSHFFADLAEFFSNNINSIRNQGFKSENILLKPNNLTEVIFILSVLDLNNKTQIQNQKYIKDEGLGLTIETNTNCYILTKELNESKLEENSKNSLLLAQITNNYYDNDIESNEEEPEKYLINKIYLQKIIVTNISNKPINCEILMQIPEGSIPIESLEYTIIENINIQKFKSVIFEQKFYFPSIGKFKQFPISASNDDLVIAKGKIKEFEVVESQKLEKDKIKSIDDVLEQGNKKQILEFIKNTNVIKHNDLSKILYLLSDKNFFESLIQILESKFYYDDNIWQYSIYHKNIPILKTYIMNQQRKNIFNNLGNYLDLIFFKTDKTNNAHIINHKDYYPIINSRIFKLPKAENSILNLEFRKTYQNFISYLITLKEIDNESLMRFCYYLILQQRIDDAIKIYNRINKEKITENKYSSLTLQYDYITAYLDFYIGYPKFEKAKEIINKYKDFPLSTWAEMFKEIKDELNEYEGKENYEGIENMEIDDSSILSDKKDKKLKAKEEEDINIEIKDKLISVLYKNVNIITIKYYLIDVEVLFSRNPFMKKSTVDFNYVSPSEIKTYNVEKSNKENTLNISIPESLKNKNIYIEVSGNKKKEYETYYSSLLKCSILESIGEIKILSPELKPLPKVYIKCFCKDKNGNIQFYKDGFTDLRGKFNYVTLNSDLINKVKKFSILIMSKEYGSLIKKCKPPKMIKGKNNESSYEQFKNYRQEVKNRFLNNKQNMISNQNQEDYHPPAMISKMLDFIK